MDMTWKMENPNEEIIDELVNFIIVNHPIDFFDSNNKDVVTDVYTLLWLCSLPNVKVRLIYKDGYDEIDSDICGYNYDIFDSVEINGIKFKIRTDGDYRSDIYGNRYTEDEHIVLINQFSHLYNLNEIITKYADVPLQVCEKIMRPIFDTLFTNFVRYSWFINYDGRAQNVLLSPFEYGLDGKPIRPMSKCYVDEDYYVNERLDILQPLIERDSHLISYIGYWPVYLLRFLNGILKMIKDIPKIPNFEYLNRCSLNYEAIEDCIIFSIALDEIKSFEESKMTLDFKFLLHDRFTLISPPCIYDEIGKCDVNLPSQYSISEQTVIDFCDRLSNPEEVRKFVESISDINNRKDPFDDLE